MKTIGSKIKLRKVKATNKLSKIKVGKRVTTSKFNSIFGRKGLFYVQFQWESKKLQSNFILDQEIL